MTMVDALIAVLTEINSNVFRQGTLNPDEGYPDSFFTFWNNDSQDHAHYDNVDYGTAWNYSIYFYSTDPTEVYTAIEATRQALKADGWIVPSKGFDVVSDVSTHTGRGLQIYKLET